MPRLLWAAVAEYQMLFATATVGSTKAIAPSLFDDDGIVGGERPNFVGLGRNTALVFERCLSKCHQFLVDGGIQPLVAWIKKIRQGQCR